MPDEYEKLKKEFFSAKLFKKIKLIKEGEFPKLFKYEFPKESEIQKKDPFKIPKEQIAAFEKTKKEEAEFKFQQETEERAVKKSLDKRPKLTGIDEILAIRQEMKSTKLADEPEKKRSSRRERFEASATEKIREGSMKAWVDRCYDVVHGVRSGCDDLDIQTGADPDIQKLLNWDRLPLGLDNVLVQKEALKSESGESLDKEPSSVDYTRSSSDETEKILRAKAGAPLPQKEEEDKKEFESQSEVEVKTKSGVNFVLSDYFVRNLQELKSLAFNEELYAFHPELGIVGSWSVDAKVCETDHKRVNVQFEGLLVDEDTNYAMYSAGIVDRRFTPVSEFRVEQVTKPNETRSRTMFFHKKRSKWLLDLREGVNDTETRKTLTHSYQQMLRVLSEGAHILLMRKIVMYCHPFCIEEIANEFMANKKKCFCPCPSLSQTCVCKLTEPQFALKPRFKLKMRSLCIGGDICRTNYRFFKPVRVTYNRVELEVVRVRRRVEMPGNLVQTSNYYMTTAGQLMGVTFNDPYPFDTPFWLQVDPKAVLNRHRVVSPERIVPLRERVEEDLGQPERVEKEEKEIYNQMIPFFLEKCGVKELTVIGLMVGPRELALHFSQDHIGTTTGSWYMCDPELKQFYEDEVERLMIVNKTYMCDHPPLRNSLKAIFQDLLNDKPHRVVAFIQDFFFEGYRFKDSYNFFRLPPGDWNEENGASKNMDTDQYEATKISEADQNSL